MYFIKIAISIFLCFFIFLQDAHTSNNLEWNLVKKYKENGKTIRHYFATIKQLPNKMKVLNERNNSNRKNQSYLKDDGTLMMSIDGGLNWYAFIQNQNHLVNFELFPNPSIDLININFFNSMQSIKKITILDIFGNEMHHFIDVYTNLNKVDINLLPKGIYVLNLETLCGNKGSMNFIKN